MSLFMSAMLFSGKSDLQAFANERCERCTDQTSYSPYFTAHCQIITEKVALVEIWTVLRSFAK